MLVTLDIGEILPECSMFAPYKLVLAEPVRSRSGDHRQW